jgi:hypothetical protein
MAQQRGPAVASQVVAPADARPLPVAAATESIEIAARPIVHFDRSNPDRKVFGRLEFRGGLVLTSPSPRFGGLSGLEIAADGRRFVAVSDETGWLTGEIAYDGRRPKGIVNARMGDMLGLAGRPLDKKRDHDAESVVLAEGTLGSGTLLIGFERNHRIGRFPIRDGVVGAPTGYLKLPPEARRISSNRGLEAVGVLLGGPMKGSVLAFTERFLDADGNHVGWLWQAGEPQRLLMRNIDKFEVTDLKGFADGSILVLERFFRWTEGVKMRLRHVKAPDIRPGALLDGVVLLEADMGYDIDNMEGLAVHRGPAGETVLTLVSDDNFNHFLQRTILLQFTLRLDGAAAAAR